MTDICIFAELHYAVQKPDLVFRFNNQKVNVKEETVELENFNSKTIFKFDCNLNQQNYLQIELKNKNDSLVTTESDHWVDIKNIVVDNIDADWLLLINSKFNHSMPQSWVDEMSNRGIHILPEYVPGTEMRLNGVFEYTFNSPFWIHKTKELQHLQ